jgi:hypothetical protein
MATTIRLSDRAPPGIRADCDRLRALSRLRHRLPWHWHKTVNSTVFSFLNCFHFSSAELPENIFVARKKMMAFALVFLFSIVTTIVPVLFGQYQSTGNAYYQQQANGYGNTAAGYVESTPNIIGPLQSY